MSFQRDINIAVQMMFKHAKTVVIKNIINAIRRGDITIDESKIPGLDVIISKSIDDAYTQSAKQLSEVLKNKDKQ
jgi:O-succinylbenzoate synthase